MKGYPTFRDVWKSNIDPDVSFHQDVYVQTDKTLNEYQKALFWVSYIIDNGINKCKVWCPENSLIP